MLATLSKAGALVVLLISGAISAQTIETGFLNRSMSLEGIEYKYQVYLPQSYTADESFPVILFLHGAGERGKDGLLQTEIGLGRAIRREVDRFPAITVFPQSPAEGPGWQDLGGRVAMAALDQTLAEFRTDRSRVYLTGLSMGGNGAWYLAYHHPERFAAALIICGWIEEGRSPNGILFPTIPPSSSPDPFADVAQHLSGIPIWIFHGDADPVVPVEQSQRMAAALQAVDARIQYTELPSIGHNSWDEAYDSVEVSTWLFDQKL
jgi:predicted peptidase